jgi:D-sedoheptulose 7-phosphate isomerase
VIVGKRALPALDISMLFRPWLETILHPEDIVMGFGPPEGDDEIRSALKFAQARNALTFALPGAEDGNPGYAVETFTDDPFIHQEMIEILYHTLWESVHVFLEHRELGHEVGEAGFLYPFLGQEKQETGDLVSEVAASIGMKVRDDAALRAQVGREQAEAISGAALAIQERLLRGGKLIIFGNGGSATDANDWAIDCVLPPSGYRPVAAVSLSMEPANTSGGSRNIVMALEEARKRKLLTVALLGYDGGEIKRRQLADFPVVVQCDYIPRIQEVQASIYHIIREMLEVLSRGQA